MIIFNTKSELRVLSIWVDYNNKNYIRSQCNKNIGLHRKLVGRPLDWHVEYDNYYHIRSKVNAQKGLHRKIPDVKRKYAPDNDDLADATGWEFDCGPEYDQEEQDVPYIPEGRIVSRGCYRWYGVKRNDSDCDVRQKEHRENLLNEEMKAELKCDHEFLQSDIPHMSERMNKKYSRGGYRFYEVPRNVYDIKPDLETLGKDPEWRRKYHSNGIEHLRTEMCESSDHRVSKGKPFKRTILNKVYELRKRGDSRESVARRGTRLSLVPGEGKKTFYEGIPFGTKRAPSIRNIFKKKTESKRSWSKEGEEYEEYQREEKERDYRELRPEYQDRLHRMAEERQRSRFDEGEDRRETSAGGMFREYAYGVEAETEPGSRDSRSASMKRESPRDVREEFETWRENAENARREWEMRPIERRRTENYDDQYASRHKGEAESRKPRSASTNSASPRDVREEFETWRENVENSRREWEMDPYGKRDKRPTEIKRAADNYASRNEGASRSRLEREENEYRVERRTSIERKGGPVYEDRDSRDAGVSRSRVDREENKYRVEKRTSGQRRGSPLHEVRGSRDAVVWKSSNRNENFEDRRPHRKKDRSRDTDFEEPNLGKDQVLKKLPPHVEKRMREIEEKMDRKFELVDKRDLMKHKDHPGDRGHSHNAEYEKYVTKNGSEYWVKKEENFSELHHKDSR